MRIIIKWTEKIHKGDKYDAPPIHSLCFNPDGSQLVVGAGDKILVYNPNDGSLLHTLKGHKDNIYCVAYARDGKNFASGGADKTVIIWSSKMEGVLKYSHAEAIQCLAHNPISHQLASCAISDYAIWSSEQKSVQKYRSSYRITSCAWTNDGQFLALGLVSGHVSIRNKTGEEKFKIERSSKPIWSVAFAPPSVGSTDTLVIGDWGQQLSFYSLAGQAINKERHLGFNPLFISHFPGGEYMLIGGCSNSIILMAKDGARLTTLDDQPSWVWCAKVHPNANVIAIGRQDGTICCIQLNFTIVHALYRERYAYRENLSDVIIQHLVSGQKVRIKCRDIVNKIAIYRNRLAIQLPERVVVYELNSAENQPMHYKVKDKISKQIVCSFLVVCAKHLLLCQEKRLQSMTFLGILEREWQLDSYIRYIKVTGGPPGREGILLGLKNGQVWRIFVDNPLPIKVTQINGPVRCLDLSLSRTKLAVVDESNKLLVRDLRTDNLLYQENNVSSVAWNIQYETLLCHSGSSGMAIRAGTCSPRFWSQNGGMVVGLAGSTAFYLQGSTVADVKVPLSATMYQYHDCGLYSEAYEIACLGVPTHDWEALAEAALESLNLEIARNAYIRIRNLEKLQLINDLEVRQKNNEHPDSIKATICAWLGKFKVAARLYQNAGENVKAMNMYSDLRMFDLAQECLDANSAASESESKSLIKLRAEWARSVQEPRAAAELLLAAGETLKAVQVVADQDWPDVLLDIGRRLDKSEKPALELIAQNLRRLKAIPLAAEIYQKLEDDKQVVQLHIEAEKWEDAFKLAEQMPDVIKHVHLEYAKWLAEKDQFVEANQAFIRAGQSDEAFRLLSKLVQCAICEKRYKDAGYFMWLKAVQSLELSRQRISKEEIHLDEYYELRSTAAIYYAYESIHQYLQEPFRMQTPDVLFNISRFLANETKGKTLPGISQYSILFVLSKHARILGANKLALQVIDRLQGLRAPANLQDQAEIHLLTGRSIKGGFHDPEDLLPLCYRCSAYSQHLQGSSCSSCKHKFVYSFVSFEVLPLVEFFIEDDISDEEAIKLIESQNVETSTKDKMTIMGDPFTEVLLQEDLILNRYALQQLDPRYVLIVHNNPPIPTKYYKNMMPGMVITICHSCYCVFHTDDYELQVLQKGFCAFCRVAPKHK
ncbi:intraflagellar transport protein 122 homolog [Ctenocephalides felis]|uniref:intraflagellar transport protein 122 homolog n=1 Tax=Ctenocephalides felis TaxID=7515 RepID=UPI000E6E2B53|nr:intraflagellar transport protein 122 homolog [Ctenocephalides felis]